MTKSFVELLSLWTWQTVLMAAAIFIVTFALSLGLVSLILVKLPADYFSASSERRFWDDRARWARTLGMVGKNLLGAFLVLLGIVLSLPGVPGQGILTILIGVMLLDFPGKRDLERKLVSRPKVRDGIDRLRHRFGKPPLLLE